MMHSERFVTGTWKGETAQFRSDRLIVSVRQGDAPGPVLDGVKEWLGTVVEGLNVIHPRRSQWAILEFVSLPDAGTRIPALAAEISERPAVRYAEPDFICLGHVWPNDPGYAAHQWWANKIAMNRLWKFTTGGGGVQVAIVDSGISMNALHHADHEDLKAKRFVTTHTRLGSTVDHNYIEPSVYPRDDSGHGTHIAGIIAATAQNNLGVAGANWRSRVYVARVLNTWDKIPEGSIGNVKLAVKESRRYVRPLPPPFNNGKRLVVNLSLGSPNDAVSLREMCEETAAGDTLICASAGSRGASMSEIDYPAAYAATFPHVVAVGATNQADVIFYPILDDYSAITICAPGKDIYSTAPTYPTFHFPAVPPYYGSLSGSSQACAVVSGVASLLWGMAKNLTAGDLREVIVKSAAKVAVGNNARYPRLDLSWLPDGPVPGYHIPF